VELGNGSLVKVKGAVTMDVKLAARGGFERDAGRVQFWVMPGKSTEVLIGDDAMKKLGVNVDLIFGEKAAGAANMFVDKG
jgi:hypothetical protein